MVEIPAVGAEGGDALPTFNDNLLSETQVTKIDVATTVTRDKDVSRKMKSQ